MPLDGSPTVGSDGGAVDGGSTDALDATAQANLSDDFEKGCGDWEVRHGATFKPSQPGQLSAKSCRICRSNAEQPPYVRRLIPKRSHYSISAYARASSDSETAPPPQVSIGLKFQSKDDADVAAAASEAVVPSSDWGKLAKRNIVDAVEAPNVYVTLELFAAPVGACIDVDNLLITD